MALTRTGPHLHVHDQPDVIGKALLMSSSVGSSHTPSASSGQTCMHAEVVVVSYSADMVDGTDFARIVTSSSSGVGERSPSGVAERGTDLGEGGSVSPPSSTPAGPSSYSPKPALWFQPSHPGQCQMPLRSACA